MTRKKQRWWHCAPTHKQVMEGYEKYREIFPSSVAKFRSSPMRVYFPHTKSKVEFRTTHNRAYEHWRGAGLSGAAFDEAGSMPEEAFLALEPMLTDDPTSWFLAVGSPRGRNWFCKKWNQGHDRSSQWWSNPVPWPSILRPSFSRSEWDRMRKTYPDMWFRQEFLAEFLGNVLGAFQLPVASPHEYCSFEQLLTLQGPLFIGADFARTTDFTEIAVIQGKGKVIYHERYQLKPWPYIAKRCEAIWRACGRPQMAIDATGLGDVVHAMLLEAGIDAASVIPYKFTSDSKAELVLTGQCLNQESKIQVPESDKTGCGEFDAYEVEANSEGKYKFGAPEGEHDDFVTAVLLACWLAAGDDVFDLGQFKYYEPAA